MFQRILVAVDYSPCSRAAFELAAGIARMTGGTVDVIHVVRTPELIPPEFVVTTGAGNQSLTTLFRERAQQEMDALVAKAKTDASRIGHAYVEDGDPGERILERANAGKYDLVVTGTHGRTGIKHVLVGSVAEKVVRLCPQPVLTVRLPEQR